MIQHGIYLTWSNISAQVKDKKILNNVNGYCTPGSTLAIMGASGAGKTTLLSILTKKQGSSLKVSGNVLANGAEFNETQFYYFASFVFQNDILNETLTVKETLQFTAKMKIPDRTKAEQRVNELIRDFELKRCQNTYVGGKFVKGISGGEKKRVCIALQMVSKPDLLVLDEPTSGLDSHIALNIIKIFNKLKNQGRTIIFTIHQPSYKIFTMLDRLLLLDRGQCIYQGPAVAITDYMLSLSITIPTNTTICDFFMFETSDYKAKSRNYKTNFTAIKYQQNLSKNVAKQMKQLTEVSPDGYSKIKTQQGFCFQLQTLFERQIKLLFRNKMKLGRNFGNSILMIVLLGLIFIHSISDDRLVPDTAYPTPQLIYYFIKAQGTFFITLTSTIMNGIFSVALVFPMQRQVYAKETASKTYDTLPYFINKILVEVGTLIFSVLLFAAGEYWMIGCSVNFGQFMGFGNLYFISVVALCAVAFVGNSIGFWTGSLFKDAKNATSMGPALIMPLMMFGGLYNKLNSIPKWIGWMQYISPFRYGLHALLLNEYGDQKYIKLGLGTEFDYKADLNIDLTYWENVGLLIGVSGFYYGMSFFFLKKLSSKLSA